MLLRKEWIDGKCFFVFLFRNLQQLIVGRWEDRNPKDNWFCILFSLTALSVLEKHFLVMPRACLPHGIPRGLWQSRAKGKIFWTHIGKVRSHMGCGIWIDNRFRSSLVANTVHIIFRLQEYIKYVEYIQYIWIAVDHRQWDEQLKEKPARSLTIWISIWVVVWQQGRAVLFWSK